MIDPAVTKGEPEPNGKRMAVNGFAASAGWLRVQGAPVERSTGNGLGFGLPDFASHVPCEWHLAAFAACRLFRCLPLYNPPSVIRFLAHAELAIGAAWKGF